MKKEINQLDKEVLQERLYLLQIYAAENNISFFIILEGWAQTGKGRILKTATYRMNPKKLKVYSPINTEYMDSKYPFQYKYWTHFPPKGTIFFLLKSWYHRISFGLQNGDIKKSNLSKYQKSIYNLERTLTDDGIFMIKFFLELDKDELTKRLKKAEKEKKFWEATKEDKNQVKDYDIYKDLFTTYRNITDQPFSSWHVIPADNTDKAEVDVMAILVEFMEKKLSIDSWEMMEKIMDQGEIE